MPRKLHGKELTAKEHRQWKHVKAKTGSGAQATGAVLNARGDKPYSERRRKAVARHARHSRRRR